VVYSAVVVRSLLLQRPQSKHLGAITRLERTFFDTSSVQGLEKCEE